jgi:hypothetical protein
MKLSELLQIVSSFYQKNLEEIIDSAISFSVKKQSVPFWNTLLRHIDTI